MNKKKTVCLLIEIVAAILVVLVFSTRTSPLYSLLMGNYTGNNASAAMMIGKAWVENGSVPYRDLFMTGGPLYFIIQAFGWLIGQRIGIFALEAISFAIYVLFTRRAIARLTSEKKSYLYTLLSLIPYVAAVSGGNSANQYLLPMAAVLLWMIVKSRKIRSVNTRMLLIGGIICGAAFMTNVTGAMVIYMLTITLGICAGTFAKKKLPEIMMLILGIIIPIIVILVVFGAQGALPDLVQGAFLIPVKMLGAEMGVSVMLHKLVKCALFLPLFAGGILLIKKRKKAGYAIVVATIVIGLTQLLLGLDWVQYLSGIIAAPLALAIFDKHLMMGTKRRISMVVSVLIYIAISILPVKDYVQTMAEGIPEAHDDFYTDLQEFISNNDDPQYGMIDTDLSFFLKIDYIPKQKYFTDQTELSKYLDEVEEEVERYKNHEEEVTILLITERGFKGQELKNYTLAEVYLKLGGSIFIYVY
ncbi:MAG: hypothetical protein K6G01_00260 [Eubacterium sp.]|nr:hypothetical protein [Eubacterium sp.]